MGSGFVICVLAILVLVACPPAQDAVDQARAQLRQGLLAEVEATLGPVVSAADAARAGEAWLLLGNVAYERRRFDRARERYARLLELPGVDEGLRQTARGNLTLATEQSERMARVAAQARRLRAVVGGVLAVGALIVVLLARRARPQVRAR